MGIQIYRDISVDFSNCRYIILNAKQHDSKSRYVRVTCTNLGTKVNFNSSDYSAFIRYRKSDGYGVFNPCVISDEGQIIFELTEQMLASVGTGYADLMIINNVKSNINEDLTIISQDGSIIENNISIVSTMTFYINVLEKPLDDRDIVSSNEYCALNDLLTKVTKNYEYIIGITKEYMENAKISADNAADSETNAKQSEDNAKESETNTKDSEINAKESETNAKQSEINAKQSEDNAAYSETNAKDSEINAKQSEDNAKESENVSKEYANIIKESALISQSYAVGNTGIRENEDTDNAKHYYEQLRNMSEFSNIELITNKIIDLEERIKELEEMNALLIN